MQERDVKEEEKTETKRRKRLRIEIPLDAQDVERFRSIREQSGLKTNQEVVAEAVAIYEWYIKFYKQGYQLQMSKGRETIKAKLVNA